MKLSRVAAPFPVLSGCSVATSVCCSASVVVSVSGTAAQCTQTNGMRMGSLNRLRPGFVYLCDPMPKRQTKRGDERTPLSGSYDVIVCGASFAGLTVARQLAGSGASVLVLDR